MNKTSKRIGIVAFLFPGLLLFVLFFVIPVIFVLVTSFTEWNGITDPIFIGLENYLKIFSDDTFITSIKNNILWAMAASFVQVPLALLMAMILSRRPRGWKIFRTVYFFPQVISGIALATLWQAMFNSEYGAINGLLKLVGLEQYATNWLGNPDTALLSIMIYWVFYIGYYLVIFMSDIASVDESFYEAAEIDGATKIQQDLRITLPIIKNSIFTCVTLAAIFGIRTFDQVFAMTNGGPNNRTSVLGLFLYKNMQNGNYGRANSSAVILILLGILVIFTIRYGFSIADKISERRQTNHAHNQE